MELEKVEMGSICSERGSGECEAGSREQGCDAWGMIARSLCSLSSTILKTKE
jgi:hypothetical protein